jgi:RNA polymerase sigma-70 factor (ECF subfamily)
MDKAAGALVVLGGVEDDTYADWETVYLENVVPIYRQIFGRVGNRPDAEDLCEDVFLRSLPKLRLPSPAGQVRAYLNAAMRTVLADHWRKHYGAPAAEIEIDQVADPGREQPAEEGGRVLRILARLPERSRQILELRFLRGYSIKEAAKQMGVTPGNAKVIQVRALRMAAQVGAEVGQ